MDQCSYVKLDIMSIHSQVQEQLQKELDVKLPELRKKRNTYQQIIESSHSNKMDKWEAQNRLPCIEKHIIELEQNTQLNSYISDVSKILEEYNAELSVPIKVSFMGKKSAVDSSSNDKLVNIIDRFFKIVRCYTDLKMIDYIDITADKCQDCGIKLTVYDDSVYICTACGYTVNGHVSTPSFNESNRINVSHRYIYDKKAHFSDSVKKFQGKQNTTISDKLYKTIETKMRNHNISKSELTIDHLYEFLRSTGFSDHYEDVSLIFHKITGHELPDISHLESPLYKLFAQIDAIYDRYKEPGRVNFLNGQFVLFKLLQKLKYPCSEDDFYFLKTREKILEHDRIWKGLCLELNWEYIPTT